MSKDVNRDQVFQTTRVRTALKNDVSWIHKSEKEKEEQDKAWTESAVETTPVPAKNKSYVLSAVKKYNGSEQANATPTKNLVENVEVQQKKIADSTTAENKDEYAVTPLGQSNVEHDKPKVSEDCVEDPSAATSTVTGVGKSRDHAEVPALLADKVPKEEPSTVAEPENATYLDEAGVQLVVVESLPRTPAVIATPGGKAALQHSVETVPNNASKSPTKSAAETAGKSEESKGKSAAPAEPGLKTRAEELVQCEIQPGKNTIVKQSIDSVPEHAADHVMELSNKDAFEPVTASKAGPVQDKSSGQTTEVTDLLDVAPPTAETVSKHVNDPKQSHSERTELNQSDDTNMNDKALCSFCNQIINGNVKITVSEPPVTCHMDCLKCGVCAKALGDFLTPMFLHDQVIHCDGCFMKALMT